jgi:hypothetical protein
MESLARVYAALMHRVLESSSGANMLDFFYIAVVVIFFALLWAFCNAAERM